MKTSSNAVRILLYNENKVAQDKARLIHAENFLQDKGRLTYAEKLHRFQRLNELNSRSKVNMLHISVNFQPGENLTDEQLTAIADRYMQGLGLGGQPYLVYRHDDATHPHIHIVTSLIYPDGRRVRTHNIASRLSEPTRKAIEKEFNLMPAGHKRERSLHTEGDAQKLTYASDTNAFERIRQVLENVNRDYRFTSLQEYNAILRQYNVLADPGRTGSQTRKHAGLLYRMLDDQGNTVGPPIKASAFDSKPTLANLQKKFEQHQQQRAADLATLRQKVDRNAPPGTPLRESVTDLQMEGIELVTQREKGQPAGLVYVDNRLRIAAHNHDLGRPPLPELPSIPEFNNRVPQLLSTLLQHDETFGQPPRELREDQRIRQRYKR
jgi:hypothetical protein